MNIPWYVFALSAATILGVHYLLMARALTAISPITAYWIPTILMVAAIPLLHKNIISDFKTVLVSEPIVQVSVALISFTSFAATVCLYKAIQSHNPVHAALLEITYPLFIAFFAFLLFQENHFNMGTIIGGSMIIAGAGVIIYTST